MPISERIVGGQGVATAALTIGVPCAVAVALWWVPGFNTLDYHGCLALGPVCGAAAAFLSVRIANGRITGHAARWLPWVGLGPVMLLAAAGLVVPWCDPTTGLVFAALGPLASTIVGTCWGAIAAGTARIAGLKPSRAGWIVVALFLVTAAPPLWFFYAHPQAFGFHSLVGWIAGPLYEDAVAPGWSYIAFRLVDLAAWPMLALAVNRPSRRLAFVIAATALAVGCMRAGPEGWLVSTDRVNATLSVRVEVNVPAAKAPRPAVVLHLPRGERFARQRHLLVEDIAVRYQQLSAFFGQPAGDTVHVFVYPDRLRKRALMGAERVELAKPWLRQVHIAWPGYGASIVTHELAHAFSADLAGGPLRLPMRKYVVPDALLIEGLAVAAEWPIRSGLTPHQWARAMRRLRLAPGIESLFSPAGFFAHSGARSYTIAGSFLRWLRAAHGKDAVRTLYATADIHQATGSAPRAVFAAWATFVDSDAAGLLSPTDMARAEARFERAAFFFRPCPLHVGRQHREASRLFGIGRYGDRARLLDDLAADLGSRVDGPGDPRLSLSRSAAWLHAGQPQTAGACLADVERTKTTKVIAEARLRLLGDAAFRAGNGAEARRRWAVPTVLGESALRGLFLRLQSTTAADLLAAGPPIRGWRDELDRQRAGNPGDAAIAYLWIRHHLFDRERPAGFDAAVRQARTLGAPIAPEIERLIALDSARKGRCDAIGGDAWYVPRYVDRCKLLKKWRAMNAG